MTDKEVEKISAALEALIGEEPKDPFVIDGPDVYCYEILCEDCVEKAFPEFQKENPDAVINCDISGEYESGQTCDRCGAILGVTLSYSGEEELIESFEGLLKNDKEYRISGLDAWELAKIIDGDADVHNPTLFKRALKVAEVLLAR